MNIDDYNWFENVTEYEHEFMNHVYEYEANLMKRMNKMEYDTMMALPHEFVIVLTNEFVRGAHGDDGIAVLYNWEVKEHMHDAWDAHRFPVWLMPHFQHIADKFNTTCHAYDVATR